jgi:hypothetical protein
VPTGGTLALTGSLTGTSGVTTILSNVSGVTGGSLPGFGDATVIGNSGQALGDYTTSTTNHFATVSELVVGVSGSSTPYEDPAFYGNCHTYDPSTTTAHHDCVGAQFTAVIDSSLGGTASFGQAYGMSAQAIANGDGKIANEFDGANNSTFVAGTGLYNSKYALTVASKGTNPLTADIYVEGGGGQANAGIVFSPTSLTSTATGGYWEGFGTVGSATVLTSEILPSGMGNFTFLSIGGNGPQSATAWLSGGIALSQPNTNYTDTSSTGTVNEETIDGLGNGTLSATNTITVNNLDTLYIPAPVAGTNVTAVNLNSINAGGTIRGTGGEVITGAAVSLDANSNFAVNIATGSSTGAINLGGSSAALAIGTANVVFSAIGTGTPTNYACFTATNKLISSATAC